MRNLIATKIAAATLLVFGALRVEAAPCAPQNFEASSYVVCLVDPAKDDLRLYWREPNGHAYGGLDPLAKAVAARGRSLHFAMNAGMFEEDLSPVGLYIENGKEFHKADVRGGGESNFHLKPNGIFWIGEKTAGVTETSRYLAAPPHSRFATQSGPMLVIEGRIHPKIHMTGTSEKLRNGVGMRQDGRIVFAISDGPVTFHAFARLFRDALGCPNALFFDGSVSSLYSPELKRNDGLTSIGPIVGVEGPKAEADKP